MFESFIYFSYHKDLSVLHTSKTAWIVYPPSTFSVFSRCSPAPLVLIRRFERVTDDKDGGYGSEERAENVCVAQYQSTTLRVLTQFVSDVGEMKGATEEERLGQQNFLLGTDWHVDVTQLVKESLRVEDPKIAELLEGQVLIGLSAGTTKLQVGWIHILLQLWKSKLKLFWIALF